MRGSGTSTLVFEGEVFLFLFSSVSYELYNTADLHLQIRTAGMSTKHYLWSMVDDTGQNYTLQMPKPGMWCNNIIIQALSNGFTVLYLLERTQLIPDKYKN